MKIIPWWSPKIGKQEYSLIKKVLKSNFPNEGKITTNFEREIEKLLQVKHAIAVTSGTAAMYLSLKALGIGPGNEVIVPDITFVATANAVEMTGAKAVLIDVNPNTLMIDEQLFTKHITPKTRAIIPVHVSGRPANIINIKKIADKKNVFVVEDAAEAFMSKVGEKYLGTVGNTGCFSFSPAKIITTGQGGVVVTNDTKLFETIKKLKDQGRPIRGTGGNDIHESLGFNFKFTDLQAALGIGQLLYLPARIKRLKRNNLLYKKMLLEVKQIRIFESNVDNGALPLWTDIVAEKRDSLEASLRKNGIDCRKFWFPVHTQSYYKSSDKNFPTSSKLSPLSLWLPSAFTLTDKDIVRVCELIKQFYDNEKK